MTSMGISIPGPRKESVWSRPPEQFRPKPQANASQRSPQTGGNLQNEDFR
jgi:hypothetical protein